MLIYFRILRHVFIFSIKYFVLFYMDMYILFFVNVVCIGAKSAQMCESRLLTRGAVFNSGKNSGPPGVAPISQGAFDAQLILVLVRLWLSCMFSFSDVMNDAWSGPGTSFLTWHFSFRFFQELADAD